MYSLISRACTSDSINMDAAAHSEPPPAHAITAMNNENSRFLRLPREMRDTVYGYPTSDMQVSVPKWNLDWDSEEDRRAEGEVVPERWPAVSLEGRTTPDILRICGRTHDEYAETMRSKSTLHINMVGGDVTAPLRWKASVPKDGARTVRNCIIYVSWSSVAFSGWGIESTSSSSSARWRIWHAGLKAASLKATDWTPTKRRVQNASIFRHGFTADSGVEFCVDFERFLVTVAKLVDPTAKVTLRLCLGGLDRSSRPLFFQQRGPCLP